MQNSTLAKIALTAAVAVAGLGFIVYSTAGHAEHYRMVDQLMAGDLTQWEGKELKVHGWVESGSIREMIVNQETHRTFVLQVDGKKIRVFNSGPKPDTFKDQSEVVATGHLVAAAQDRKLGESLGVALESDLPYVLESSDLMAKCPSKYDGARVNLSPQNQPPEFK